MPRSPTWVPIVELRKLDAFDYTLKIFEGRFKGQNACQALIPSASGHDFKLPATLQTCAGSMEKPLFPGRTKFWIPCFAFKESTARVFKSGSCHGPRPSKVQSSSKIQMAALHQPYNLRDCGATNDALSHGLRLKEFHQVSRNLRHQVLLD